ncbi:myosin-11-like isoform X2 [Oscarella lobularis]|uniref:myosin-11-like isoform X2 n=1 Tax=Oscarella lobularis TaxID=121494 RepID=UPI003313396B
MTFQDKAAQNPRVKWRKQVVERTNGDASETTPLETLQVRVEKAEGRTQELVRRLAALGYSSEAKRQAESTKSAKGNDDIVRSALKRVERTEEALETIKSRVDSVQKEQESAKSRSSPKAKKDFTVELRMAKSSQSKLEKQVEKLTSALDVVTSNKMALLTQLENVKGGKQRAINKLKEQLDSEMKLRASLEESHNCLLEKIQCVDGVVELARRDVKLLTRDSESLRRELIKGRKELELEKDRRKSAEMQTEEYKATIASKDADLEKLRKSNDDISERNSELEKMVKKLQSGKKKDSGRIRELEVDNGRLKDELDFMRKDRESVEKGRQETERLLGERQSEERNVRGELEDKMRSLEIERDDARRNEVLLSEELAELKEKLRNSQLDKESDLVRQLREELRVTLDEKNQVMSTKEELLEEVNQAIDDMAKERDQLTSQLSHLQNQLDESESRKTSLEEELNRSKELQRTWQNRSQDKVALEALKVELTAAKLERDHLESEYRREKTRLEQIERERNECRDKVFAAEKSCRVLEEDNCRLADSLESLMSSNHELQAAMLSLKGELERKVDALASADEIKVVWETSLERLQNEVGRLQGQLIEAEKRVPRESAKAAERVAKTWTENRRLKEEVEKTREEMEGLEKELVAMKKLRDEEERRARLNFVQMEEEIKSRDRQGTAKLKAVSQENKKLSSSLSNLQRQHETSLIVKAQLETKVQALETELAKLRRDVMGLRGQLTNARKTAQKTEEKRYEEKQNWMRRGEVNDAARLRKDLEIMAEAQRKAEKLLEEQARELERLRRSSAMTEEQLKAALAEKEGEMRRIESVTQDAMEKSSQASSQLQELRDLYESQVVELNAELSEAKKFQADLEKRGAAQQIELLTAREKAKSQARRAQEVVKASRLMISKLASQAESEQQMAKGSLERIKSRLELEKELSHRTAKKYQHLKVTSALRCEELARELAEMKTQNSH